MTYKINYKSSIQKDLKRISKSEAVKIINEIEFTLLENPLQFPQLQGKFRKLRKFRIGNYRVIYSIEQNNIIILKIGNRKDIYR